jgi:hypothetical protein
MLIVMLPGSAARNFRVHIRHRLERESNHDKTIGAMSVCEALVTGHFSLARLTPCRPEINEHHLPTKLSRGQGMSLQVFD